MKRARIRAYDGESVEIRVRDPQETAAVETVDRQARALDEEDVTGYGRAIVRIFDLGTFAYKRPDAGVSYDSYREIPLEGLPYLGPDDRLRNREYLLEAHGPRYTLESGETVASAFQLQYDTQTALANVSLELRGPRGSRIRGISTGSEAWQGVADVAEQRESIANLRASRVAQANNDGLDRWSDLLDRRNRRQWSTEIAHRVDHEGEFRLKMAPGQTDLVFRSAWQYESWALGDRQRYMVTHGHQILDAALDPAPTLRLASSRSTRLDIYAAPQLHRVRFDWIDIYILSVGWWLTVIYLPTMRLITLRSAQFPYVFTGAGVPEQDLLVGDTMSNRIARTNAFAGAVRSRIFSSYFRHVGSVQGRYGVYQRDQEAETLCAVLEYRWPVGDPEVLRVFRRVTIERPNTLLELGGLYVPGIVTPWVKGLIIDGQSGASGDPTEGY